MRSPVEHRNIFFTAIDTLLDTNLNMIFPREINILTVSQSSTAGYVRITLDRAIQAVNSDSITITGSTDYNGDYSITRLSIDKKALDILHSFTVTRTGKIEGTSHRYKNSEDQIKNFPAVIMEISDTEFTEDNVNKVSIVSNVFYFQVIDVIDKYTASTEMDKIELTQDFVWKQAVAILGLASKSYEMDVNIENLETYETIIDKNKKCVGVISQIKINQR